MENKNQPAIKMNAVPQGCTRCWQERKKHIRTVLANMDLSGKLYTLTIPIVGVMNKGDKEKFTTIVKQELVRLKRGYIDVQIIQL